MSPERVLTSESPEQYARRVAGMNVDEAVTEWCELWYKFSLLDSQGQDRISYRKHKFAVFNDNVSSEVSTHLEAPSDVFSSKLGDYLTNGQKIRREAEIKAGVRPAF